MFAFRALRSAAAGMLVLTSPATAQSGLQRIGPPRWPDRTVDAVRVWIQPASTIPHWTPAHVVAVRDAFTAWSRVDIGVPFSYVVDSSAAEIRVRWVDKFDDAISGHTVADHDPSRWIYRASMDLAVRHHSGVVLDNDAMRAIALHEVGHVLGLEHSDDSTTLMAPAVRVRTLTDADRAALRRLYGIRDPERPAAHRPPR